MRPTRLPTRGAVVALAPTLLVLLCAHAPAAAAGGELVTTPFIEEFDGPAGAAPNPQHWTIDVGSSAVHGWEAGSLQTYTESPDNVGLDGRGHLMITARRDDSSTFTSGRVVTRGKLDFGLGTLIARIKFPTGQGMWPAFWMLGSDIESVGWPNCGEIDIMELVNEATTYHVALHGPDVDAEATGPTVDLSKNFHNYWVTRTPNKVAIGIDSRLLASFTPETLPPGSPWVFSGPMFVLLNLAVGGDWPGPPTAATTFPATMLVDWLRFVPLG